MNNTPDWNIFLSPAGSEMNGSTFQENAVTIVRRLRDAGFNAYIVGGAVRDMVMGLTPKDYDIATDASPEAVAGLFGRTHAIGAQFGIGTVTLGGHAFEVAQFRKDGVYEDGRHPSSTEPSGALEDVKRRDFTINALLYDPDTDTIIDHVGGVEDIHAGIVRTIGAPEQRFAEDNLRMLRAVRFTAHLDFMIDKKTLDAIKRNALNIGRVSNERVRDELNRMFTGNHPDRAFTLLDETGLLAVVLPEVSAMKGIAQPETFHPEGDVFEHTRLMFKLFGGGAVPLAWGILLHDVGKPPTLSHTDRIRFTGHDTIGAEMAKTIMKRLKFSTILVNRVTALVKNHLRFIHVRDMKKSTLHRFMSLDGFHEMLELYRLDCLASHGNLEIYDYLQREMACEHREKKNLKLPAPLLNGHDLIALGYEPGPLFKEMLNHLIDAQIEKNIATREEAVAFIAGMFRRKRLR